MTGREFCDVVGIDYDYILRLRAADREANYDEFLEELLQIHSVRRDILKKLTG